VSAGPPSSPSAGSLTDEAFWDRYWRELCLPREVEKGTSLYLDAITDVFDRWLPRGDGQTVLEVGGAPGQYGAYIHRRLGYRLHVLDSSAVGCEATRRNLELLGIEGDVVHGDMFDPTLELPPFDVAYSLGLIEHFADLTSAVSAHARFVKPGGLLAIGCPNFLGVNGMLLRWLAPGVVATTNPSNMDVRSWTVFERQLGLEPLFKGYVGGFEPAVAARTESPRQLDRATVRSLQILAHLLGRRETQLLRRLNSRWWSGYVMGVYRVWTHATNQAPEIR
jgi:SAM-dependent methyltransferase